MPGHSHRDTSECVLAIINRYGWMVMYVDSSVCVWGHVCVYGHVFVFENVCVCIGMCVWMGSYAPWWACESWERTSSGCPYLL